MKATYGYVHIVKETEVQLPSTGQRKQGWTAVI